MIASTASFYLYILRLDPKRRATTAQPTTANDGERDPAEDIGLGAGASAANAGPIKQKTTAIKEMRVMKEGV